MEGWTRIKSALVKKKKKTQKIFLFPGSGDSCGTHCQLSINLRLQLLVMSPYNLTPAQPQFSTWLDVIVGLVMRTAVEGRDCPGVTTIYRFTGMQC